MGRGWPVPRVSSGRRTAMSKCPVRFARSVVVAALVLPVLVPGPNAAGASPREAANTTWGVVPVLPTAVYGGLSSPTTSVTTGNMTCMSESFCVLAGYGTTSGFISNKQVNYYQPLLWSWNGHAWSDVPNPVPGAGALKTGIVLGKVSATLSGSAVLLGTACSSTTSCWAVGANLTGPAAAVIEHWDGDSWTSSKPGPASGAWLNAVACASENECFAVGSEGAAVGGTNASSSILVEEWDGTKWSLLVSGQKPSPALAAWLDSVTCLSATKCLALGDWYNAAGDDHFVAEEYGPSSGQPAAQWSPVLLSDTSGYKAMNGTGPYGISCLSTTDCLGVGNGAPYATYSGAYFPAGVVLHWDGSSWTKLSTPKYYNQPYELNGVACAPGGCWVALRASGPVSPASTPLALAHWAGPGSAFQVVTMPGHGFLSSVSCLPDGSWCMTFGQSTRGTSTHFIALREAS